MSMKEKLFGLSTARTKEVEIPGVGTVLFVEPFLAEIRQAQTDFLVYDIDENDGDAKIKVDSGKSDMDGYNRTLIALAARDKDTKERVFADQHEVEVLFSQQDENGFPRVGSSLFAKFVSAAVFVCGMDVDGDTKKKRARGN